MGHVTEIASVEPEELDELLPLIAGYQRFYGVREPDDERNRAFFARFTAPEAGAGVLLAARRGGRVCGFACVYWSQESIAAEDIAVLHDLFVTDAERGTGAGRALIEAAATAARSRGLRTMTWMTALDNRVAQGLYDSLGAQKSTWHEYELTL
jgi:GNAT superfamily N-acetyltransferase